MAYVATSARLYNDHPKSCRKSKAKVLHVMNARGLAGTRERLGRRLAVQYA